MRSCILAAMLVVAGSLVGTVGRKTLAAEPAVDVHGEAGVVTLADRPCLRFTVPRVAGRLSPEVNVVDAGHGWQRVRMTWSLTEPVPQDELAVEFSPVSQPDFWWAPHLAPRDGDAIAQHVFRSPAMIAVAGRKTLVVVPDLQLCGQLGEAPWFMDLDAQAGKCWLGMAKTKIWVHVGYEKIPGMVLPAGELQLGFYVTAYNDQRPVPNPWAKVSRFLWERFAKPLYDQGQPSKVVLDRFVEHTYDWAFDRWKHAVWQEFEIQGRRVGAPAFIVNFTESPNYPGPYLLREYLSIWNQAWFSSLRSASGVMRYARRTGREDLRQKANLTKEFALAAPMSDGIFPTVYRTEMVQREIRGQKVWRSKGWETGYWANSNRVPRDAGITEDLLTGHVGPQYAAPDPNGNRRVGVQEYFGPRLTPERIHDISRNPKLSILAIDQVGVLAEPTDRRTAGRYLRGVSGPKCSGRQRAHLRWPPPAGSSGHRADSGGRHGQV